MRREGRGPSTVHARVGDLSPDRRRVYYHQPVNGRFAICRVRRRPGR
jgi:hypothetical protein